MIESAPAIQNVTDIQYQNFPFELINGIKSISKRKILLRLFAYYGQPCSVNELISATFYNDDQPMGGITARSDDHNMHARISLLKKDLQQIPYQPYSIYALFGYDSYILTETRAVGSSVPLPHYSAAVSSHLKKDFEFIFQATVQPKGWLKPRLSPKEMEVFTILSEAYFLDKDQHISIDQISDQLCTEKMQTAGEIYDAKSVRVEISQLNKKLRESPNCRIVNQPYQGYKLSFQHADQNV